MHPTARAFKQQILQMDPNKLRKIILTKFNIGQDDEFEVHMQNGLRAAIAEQSALAHSICPWLIRSGEYRLVEVFTEILPGLWPKETKLLKDLVEEAKRLPDESQRKLVANMLATYREDASHIGPKFAKFLRDEKL